MGASKVDEIILTIPCVRCFEPTVPSQKDLSKFKSNSMSVKRVRNLSGGNYWGHETKSDVALSVSEIFNCNFGHAFDESIIKHIDNTIKNQNLSFFYDLCRKDNP